MRIWRSGSIGMPTRAAFLPAVVEGDALGRRLQAKHVDDLVENSDVRTSLR